MNWLDVVETAAGATAGGIVGALTAYFFSRRGEKLRHRLESARQKVKILTTYLAMLNTDPYPGLDQGRYYRRHFHEAHTHHKAAKLLLLSSRAKELSSKVDQEYADLRGKFLDRDSPNDEGQREQLRQDLKRFTRAIHDCYSAEINTLVSQLG